MTDLPQSISLPNPEGQNSGSSSLPSTQVLDGGAMGGLVMTNPFHHSAVMGLGEPGGYFGLPGTAGNLGVGP